MSVPIADVRARLELLQLEGHLPRAEMRELLAFAFMLGVNNTGWENADDLVYQWSHIEISPEDYEIADAILKREETLEEEE